MSLKEQLKDSTQKILDMDYEFGKFIDYTHIQQQEFIEFKSLIEKKLDSFAIMLHQISNTVNRKIDECSSNLKTNEYWAELSNRYRITADELSKLRYGLLWSKNMAEKKKWIAKATENKGGLHRATKTPVGEKIPAKKLAKAAKSSSPKVRKEVALAKTLSGMRKKK